MGKVLNALQVQGFFCLFIICFANAAPYSKYGRSCKDIGCLPREVCVMAYDTCSFGKRENENCGRYPTCKRNTDPAATHQNTDFSPNSDSFLNIPTVKVTTTRYTTPRTTTTTRRPYIPPTTPSYSGGGFSNIFGGGGSYPNRYGDNDGGSLFGGGGFSRTTTRYTTRRPSSSSSGGGFFDSIFSGAKDALSGQIGSLINDALRGGSGGTSNRGGFGSLFDTRPIQENKGYRDSLFNENTNTNQRTTSSLYSPSSSGSTSTNPRYGWNFGSGSTPNSTPPTYGWRIQ